MAQRSWAGAALPTTITAGISGGTTTFSVANATGWPTGGATAFIAVIDRELATEEKVVVASRSGVVFTVALRGHDGTSAVAHDLGAPIEHCLDAESLTRFDRHVEDPSRDDHTQYQKESEKGAANGYASLDSGGKVPDGQIDSTIARDSEIAGQVAALQALICPVGTYRVSAEASPGTGWALCDGSSQLRAGAFAALFAVIGTTYGSVDGTHFNLPDGRGRTLIGAGTGAGLTTRTLGQQAIGAETVTLTGAQSGLVGHNHTQQSHNHTQNSHFHNTVSHAHTMDPHNHSGPSGNTAFVTVAPIAPTYALATGGGIGSAATTENTTATMQQASPNTNNQTAVNQAATALNDAVSGTNALSSHENMPPSIVANLFIKT